MVKDGEIVEERRITPGRRKTDLGDQQTKSTVWKIVEGIAIAAVLAAASLTWSTREEVKTMQVQLSGVCVSVPEIKSKVDRHDLALEKSLITDEAMKGRMYFLEESLRMFEKRVDRYLK